MTLEQCFWEDGVEGVWDLEGPWEPQGTWLLMGVS